MSHFIEKCKHGIVRTQCRCASANKVTKIVSCDCDESQVNDDKLKELAEYIILSQTEDIEYLTIREVTHDRVDELDLDTEELSEIVKKVDKLISKAKVTVTFED